MEFTKMQGLGNDYLYVRAERLPEDAAALSVRLSDRHFGPGADGMIWILPSDCADAEMRIFNADGSEARMCGNGIRCVGKYLYERGICRKTALRVQTLAGIKTLQLQLEGERVASISVGMGTALVSDPEAVTAAGRALTVLSVDMGNPHAVCFVPEVSDDMLQSVGPTLQAHPRFPGGVNFELAALTGENRLRMRVWERGSGVTLACGTGACATAAAAVSRGLCAFDAPIRVQLDGGELQITVDREFRVSMTGPAEFVYSGQLTVESGE